MTLIKENDFVMFKFENKILLIKVKEKGVPTDEEWEFTKKIIIDFYNVAIEQNFKFSLVFDLENLGMMPVAKLKDWARLFKENKEKTRIVIHKTAMITANTLVRFTLNMFLGMYKTNRPSKIVGSFIDAIQFVSSS